ncbi:hypothetical protein ANN_01364 [Periplaneta americana]|uniref:Uncharacterized protein n=1 Tax=Periplaneta americana TaxID=6978 RepID=A0ABQ8TW98_PERAM|nr:hypothetical protein ANN_01364 [Periplaneta americana]
MKWTERIRTGESGRRKNDAETDQEEKKELAWSLAEKKLPTEGCIGRNSLQVLMRATDMKTGFSRDDIENFRNQHVWADENSHSLEEFSFYFSRLFYDALSTS